MNKTIILSLTILGASISNAFAHHPLDGAMPETALNGLLSGIGHPLLGFDHFAFIVAIGLLAALQPRRVLMPLGFILATMLGTVLTVWAITLPMAELFIIASVVFAGLVIVRGRSIAAIPGVALASIAGLFHGWAYGAAVIGAEPTPLLAYLAGFGFIQLVIIMGVGFIARQVWQAKLPTALQPRLAGAMIAGIGISYFVEYAEALIFPAL